MTTPEPELANQAPPLRTLTCSRATGRCAMRLRTMRAARIREPLSAFGHRWGAADMFERGRQANAHPPRLEVLDARGFRCDTVEFHPACHDLMAESVAARLAASTWSARGLVVRAE